MRLEFFCEASLPRPKDLSNGETIPVASFTRNVSCYRGANLSQRKLNSAEYKFLLIQKSVAHLLFKKQIIERARNNISCLYILQFIRFHGKKDKGEKEVLPFVSWYRIFRISCMKSWTEKLNEFMFDYYKRNFAHCMLDKYAMPTTWPVPITGNCLFPKYLQENAYTAEEVNNVLDENNQIDVFFFNKLLGDEFYLERIARVVPISSRYNLRKRHWNVLTKERTRRKTLQKKKEELERREEMSLRSHKQNSNKLEVMTEKDVQ